VLVLTLLRTAVIPCVNVERAKTASGTGSAAHGRRKGFRGENMKKKSAETGKTPFQTAPMQKGQE